MSTAGQGLMSPQRLGMWLVLLAEVMLFSGFIAAYVVLRAGAGSLFGKQAQILDQRIGIVCALALVTAALVLFRFAIAPPPANQRAARAAYGAAVVLGLGAIALYGLQWYALLNRVTAIAVDRTSHVQYIYDGKLHRADATTLWIHGHRADTAHVPPVDIHRFSRADLPTDSIRTTPQLFAVIQADAAALSYGPWKNAYFACYFLLTGVIAIHLLVGITMTLVLFWRAAHHRPAAALAQACAGYWGCLSAATVIVTVLLYWPQL
jgi:heme/copper-type cytochrome/quinol oxidase subunit 3